MPLKPSANSDPRHDATNSPAAINLNRAKYPPPYDAAREAHLTFPGFLGDGSILTSQLAAGACKIVTAVEAARR